MPAYFAPEMRVEVNGAGLAADVSKNIVDVRVTTAPFTLDSLALTLANPYPELPWTHTDRARLFQEGNSVTVYLGYVDDVRKLFDGEITGLTPDFPASGTPTLGVQGHNRMHRLAASQTNVNLAGSTDRDAVTQIAQAAGLTPALDDPGITYPQLTQFGESDLAFLVRRARELRYEVWVEGRTLNFKQPRDAAQPRYTLVWGRTAASFTPGALPLESFTPTLDARNQVGTVVVRGQDPLTREAFEGRAGAGDEEAAMGAVTGPQVRAAAFGGNPTLTLVDEPVASQPEAERRAWAIYNERVLQFVTGRGSTIGIPGLHAGMVVTLDGLGPRFNGDYYVTRCTHALGGGGYRTEFEVRRNAVGA